MSSRGSGGGAFAIVSWMQCRKNREGSIVSERSYSRKKRNVMRIADYVELQPQDMKDFMKLARERFKIAVDAESSEREKRLDDLKFATGDQWPQETKRIRDASNRPCLTINRYPAVKGQIVNEQRAQRPQIIVKPVGGGADEDDAEMLEGLLRHIQVNSDAEIAFDTAFEHHVLKCSIECDLRI